jgi:hypothetical protein
LHAARRSMEQKHGADAWSSCMEQMHGASRSMVQAVAWRRHMEQADTWSKQDHGASRSVEQAEAWSRKKHGVVACIRKKYGAEAWSRSMDR